ncbi:MAG: hypothetical protein V3V08_05505 [Nannocystaceae bacterium]
MVVQAATDYTETHEAGFKGQIADENDATVMSGVAEGDIPVGIGVVRGTANSRGVKVPTAGGTFRGVVVRNLHQLEDAATGILEIQDGNEAPLLTRGTIFVELNDTVAIDDPVFLEDVGGLFRMDATGGTAIVGATFLDAGVIGDIVRIRIPSAVA